SAQVRAGRAAVAVPSLPPDGTYAHMSELHRRTLRTVRIKDRAIPTPSSAAAVAGHWEEGGRKYIIDDPFAPQKPSATVVANGQSGFVATHSGWAYSFGTNSQQNRITPYAPDSTSELPLRGVVVTDRNTGERFSIAPNPAPSGDGKYDVEVSPGYIRYRF